MLRTGEHGAEVTKQTLVERESASGDKEAREVDSLGLCDKDIIE